eukprot:6214298-Pleurochrysis_carterae.AAC.5
MNLCIAAAAALTGREAAWRDQGATLHVCEFGQTRVRGRRRGALADRARQPAPPYRGRLRRLLALALRLPRQAGTNAAPAARPRCC